MTERLFLEKVPGGYIISEPNSEAKNTTDLWINKAVYSDFLSAVEEIRRRMCISDIIASQEGSLNF